VAGSSHGGLAGGSVAVAGCEAIGVDGGEGVVVEVGVEVGSAGEAYGVWRGPATCFGTIVASAEVEEACFGVESFAGESPGVMEGV
jgi:hypothetical protein